MSIHMRAIVPLLGLSIVGCGHKDPRPSQEPTEEEISEVCQQRACREDTQQFVQLSASEAWQGVYPRSPYIAGPGLVVVLPGESLEVVATPDAEGVLTDLRVVESGGNLSIELSQEYGRALLTVSSRFSKPLYYCATINIPTVGRVKTSTVGVAPQAEAVEMWSDPMTEVILHDFRLTDQQAECR